MEMKESRNNRIVGGVVLIAIGVISLMATVLDIGELWLYILPALGAILLIWGILARNPGPMIPGCIISGVGWALVLGDADLIGVNSEFSGALFLIVLGLGFLAIPLFTGLFSPETHWWGLIPGGIIALVGVASYFGEDVWQIFSWWPLILVFIGGYILFRVFTGRDEKEPEIETK
jgi:hypothetical protein